MLTKYLVGFLIGLGIIGGVTYAATSVLPVFGGGTNTAVFSGNSIVTSNSTGSSLQATSSTLYVGGIVATSSSYFINSVNVTPLITSAIAQPYLPVNGMGYIAASDFSGSNFASTTIGFMLFNLPQRMNVNKLSTMVALDGFATSTLGIGIYDESGNLLESGISAFPTCQTGYFAADGIGCKATTTVSLASTLNLGPGNYYLGYVIRSTSTDAEITTAFPYGYTSAGSQSNLLTSMSGKLKYFGTTTAAIPGSLPSSFNPLTINQDIVGINADAFSFNYGLVLRLDN